MGISNIVIVGLLVIIIILLIVILMRRPNDSQRTDSNNSGATKKEEKISPTIENKAISLSSVDEIVLQNSLGEELTFSRPSEISNTKYREVSINGTGNIVQSAGQGAVEIQTLNELSNIAGMELYTSEVSLEELLKNYTYTDGKIASVQFRSADGTGIRSHHGFEVFDSSSVAAIEPLLLTTVAMQGMAIVSGQYYLKQITKSLNKISKDIEELKEIHESNTRGTLRYCRKRLLEIIQMKHCSSTDLNEVRDIAGKAGEIMEQYRDRYESALREVENYKAESLFVDSAINDYNSKIAKLRYLLQVCMVADRIVDEARLAEFVIRRKIDVNDPQIEDVFNLMDEHYHNGFNAKIIEESEELTQRIRGKGKTIVKGSFAFPSDYNKLLEPINSSAEKIEGDIIDLTGCVRRIEETRNKCEHVVLLLNENGEEPRFFTEITDDEEEIPDGTRMSSDVGGTD